MSLRLRTFGAWGVPSAPPLAFDLLGAALWRGAKTAGVRRLGDAPLDPKAPAPAILSYRFAGALVQRSDFTLSGGAASNTNTLVMASSPFGGGPGVSFLSGKPSIPHRFTVSAARSADDPVAIRFYVEEIANAPLPAGQTQKEVKGHMWFLRLGNATTGGVLLRVRDGQAEICRLASTWTAANQDTYHTLLALDSPTAAQRDQTTALENALYSQVDALNGRSSWKAANIRLTLVPEPAEALENEIPTRRLHIITENAGRRGLQTIEYAPDPNAAPLADGAAPPLVWGTESEVGASGGEWHLEWNTLAFDAHGTLEWGPFYSSLFGDLGSLYTAKLAGIPKDAGGNARADVTFSLADLGGGRFKLVATLSSTDGKCTPFLHGVSARTSPGYRTESGDVGFDTSDLYKRAGEEEAREKSPILEIEMSGAATGERSASVQLRDVSGNTLGGKTIDDLLGRVALLENAGGPLLTDGIVGRASWKDVKHFATTTESGAQLRGGIWISKGKTRIAAVLGDGHTITGEVLCDPPPVGDGLHLGAQIRALLRICSFSNAQMAGVPSDFGPLLPVGNSRDGFACVPDASSTVQGALNGLMERYGLGLRLYQDEWGVWHLEARPTSIVAAFGTSRAAGRRCILAPLCFERETKDFFNFFRVIGGSDDSPIERSFLDKKSLSLAAGNLTHARYLGRLKRYPTLRDSGLKTPRAVNYALRSLCDLYNVPGRTATLESYFERNSLGKLYAPRDLITVDGIKCEVLSWEASEASDRLKLCVREVV